MKNLIDKRRLSVLGLLLVPVFAVLAFLRHEPGKVAIQEVSEALPSAQASAPALQMHGMNEPALARIAPAQAQAPTPAPAPPTDKTISFGAHFNDSEAAATLMRWRGEKRDPVNSAEFEGGIKNLFEDAEASKVLDEVECRQTLCKLSFNGGVLDHGQNGDKTLAGKLGRGVVVLESNMQGVVVLIPRDEVAL